MALFQILRGKAANLASKAFHDGYAYLTPDDGAFYIDAETDGKQKRIHINPKPDLQELTADEVQSAWGSYPPVYLTFSSPATFSIAVAVPTWTGTMEYSTDTTTWNTWTGAAISGQEVSGRYELYLRGTNNTKIAAANIDDSTDGIWSLTGSNISCKGNIETLLDYKTVMAMQHPPMDPYCYAGMFNGCEGLIVAPNLPALTLTAGCYHKMFAACSNLISVPDLPALVLPASCYYYMFAGCTNLTTAPAIAATIFGQYSCYGMFMLCSGLTSVPDLVASQVDYLSCYYMFANCSSLVTAPALPATRLVGGACYAFMFQNCTSLTGAPDLPATSLATGCYTEMFENCTSLIMVPCIQATEMSIYGGGCAMMFAGCTSLKSIPKLHSTLLLENNYYAMFKNCSSLKVSATKTDTYTKEYRIPDSGTALAAGSALTSMFDGTGGTFTGTPEVNTTYYLDSSMTIV